MAHLDRMSYLNIGGWHEDMHQAHIGVNAGHCIFLHNPGKATDLGRKARPCDLPDAIKLALRGYRKSGLDNIYAELVELNCDLELFVRGERDARSLLPVTKSCIKNANFFTNKRTNVVEDDSPRRFVVSYMKRGTGTIKLLL